VGSIGLVAAVPLTTGLAAVVVTGTGFRRAGDGHDDDDHPAGSHTDRPDLPPADPAPAPAPEGAPPPRTDGPGWDEFGPRGEQF
jgi:hypothetical protein